MREEKVKVWEGIKVTEELLKNADKKMKEIRELEDFIKAFKAPFMNCIRATSEKDSCEFMIIHSDSELHHLIMNHCNSELKRLKEEFRKL
jgi:hypothetical protein